MNGDYAPPDGEIILGAANGLGIIDQEKVLSYKNSLKESIPSKLISYSYFSQNEDQKIHRKVRLETQNEIHLAHSDRQLELSVQLMDLAGAEDHSYSYKIDGYIEQWRESVQNNKINLFGLPPGSYDIVVRASKSL